MSSTSERVAAYEAALCVYNRLSCELNNERDKCWVAYSALDLMLTPYKATEATEAAAAKPLELEAGDPISKCFAAANVQKQAYDRAFKKQTEAYYVLSAAFRAMLE